MDSDKVIPGPTRHARYGLAAIEAGTPDYAENDFRTNALDAVVNIMHALRQASGEEDADFLDRCNRAYVDEVMEEGYAE